MTPTPLPLSLLGTPQAYKTALAVLLPEMAPTRRLECLAHQMGHRTYAAATAFQATLPEGIAPSLLSIQAAYGYPMGWLVHTATKRATRASHTRTTARPRVDTADAILQAAEEDLDKAMFCQHLERSSVFAAAARAPAGAARWFFSVCAAAAMCRVSSGDGFWAARANSLLCGLLMARTHLPDLPEWTEATTQLWEEATHTWDTRGFDRWMEAAHQQLVAHHNTPYVTKNNITATAIEAVYPSPVPPKPAPRPEKVALKPRQW